MKDQNGTDLGVGDTVALATDSSTQFVIDAFDGDLVVCKAPPPEATTFNFPGDDDEQPPRPHSPDNARVRFASGDLVKA